MVRNSTISSSRSKGAFLDKFVFYKTRSLAEKNISPSIKIKSY